MPGMPDPQPMPARSQPAPASIGLFSTLTSVGSRELVLRILAACVSGEIPGVRPAFLLVEREAGESEQTDASLAEIADRKSVV